MATRREPFIYIGCHLPLRELAAFYAAPILLEKDTHLNTIPAAIVPEQGAVLVAALRAHGSLLFPSAEHVWQALKARDMSTLRRFCSRVGGPDPTCPVSGDLTEWREDFFAIVRSKARNAPTAAAMMEHWRERRCIGIMANKAAQSKYGRALGLGPDKMNYEAFREAPLTVLEAVWHWILTLKYDQNDALRQRLLATKEAQLIEFDKSSIVSRVPSFWGATMDKKTGKLCGKNVMGQALMHVRAVCRHRA